GRRVHGTRLVDQEFAPAHRQLVDVPAIIESDTGALRWRSIQPIACTCAATASRWRVGSRYRFAGELVTEPEDRRTESFLAGAGISVHAPGELWPVQLDRSEGGRSVSPGSLHVPPAINSVSRVHQFRCAKRRRVMRQAGSFEYSPPGVDAVE